MSRRLEEFSPELATKALRTISRAMRSGHAANPRLYRDPDSAYFRAVENVVVEVVYEWFASKNAPIFRDALIQLTRERILGRRSRGLWRDPETGGELPIPAQDTIRRRVNCTAEPQYYDGCPPCLMVADRLLGRDATFYFPNPASLPPDKRAAVEEVLRRWGKT